jgi:hypothetical protein
MSDHQRQFRELQPLVDQMLDGLIARDEMDVLEKSLDGNADLQRLILDYCQLHLSLQCDVRSKKAVDAFVDCQRDLSAEKPLAVAAKIAPFPMAPLGSTEVDVVSDHALSGSQPASWLASGLGFKAWPMGMMFCLGIAAALVGTGLVRREAKLTPSPAATPAAFLTSSTGCAWGAGSSKLQTVGSSVDLGDEISLQEGIAEFRLASGVYVSVEGPARTNPGPASPLMCSRNNPMAS